MKLKRHRWVNGDACVVCKLHREGAGSGPYGAMRYYRDGARAGEYLLSPGQCPNNLICACGARQTTVAYSPYYKGLMFGCERNIGCRSQDEGDYKTEQDAQRALEFYRSRYGLAIVGVAMLDPKEVAS